MRIAMVSEHASPLADLGGVDAGGQNVHVAALSEAMARPGTEVVVYTRRDSPGLPERVPMAPGVTVVHVDAGPPRFVAKDELLPHMARFAAELGRHWRGERPDVVHAHFWMSGLAALDAAEPLGIPVLQTFHALGSVKRRHQGGRDTSPAGRVEIEADIAQRADRVVATCTDELFELSRLGADTDRVSIVPCGVDTDRFRPEGPGLLGPAPGHRIVAVGRLVERKGVDDVVTALRQLPNCELVVAGGPPAGEVGHDPDSLRLLEVARAAGVAGRVHLTGRLDRDRVAALMRSADVAVCVPWYEPFGIVPLEAMACAVPVVASCVGGLADTVVDGVTGHHVAPRRPDQLAAVVGALLADPARRRRMGAAGRRRAVERYRWAAVADATTAVYRQTLSAPTRPAQARPRAALG